MSLKAGKKPDVIPFADFTGGVNLNDPAMSLSDKELADSLNAILLANGFKRWPGAVNLTSKAAITDYLRGMYTSTEIDGTQYLYIFFGEKAYSINKSTGALTELYTLSGDGEVYGSTAHGTFFFANGTDVVKIEAETAYRVGIAAPTGVTATGATSGGSLADGTYKLYASYARRVGGVDVLYSKGQEIADVTISGGGGSGKITIADFANSSDAQVGNKVIWMTGAGGSTYYLHDSTGNNTTTTWEITSNTPESSTTTYGTYASANDLPKSFTFMFEFDNRLWGVYQNKVYYSLKGATAYDLEIWSANNYITYPFPIRSLFGTGPHLCVNTKNNGVIIQPNADVSAKYEHFEEKDSFRFIRTVADWNGNKIGLTKERLRVFSSETLKFEPWDYGYNIRPVLDMVWSQTDTNFHPCGIVHRRENRVEYLLSLQNTAINEVCNNRTYALNLSRTYFIDIDRNKTPWEIVGRGFNNVAIDDDNTLFMGQSFDGSSTVYKELNTATTQVGIYGDAGTYIDTAEDMTSYVTSKTFIENMFTKQIIEDIRAMYKTKDVTTMLLSIQDGGTNTVEQESDQVSAGQSLWGVMQWGVDNWSVEGFVQYQFKGKMGVFGYTWNIKFSQTANDINMQLLRIDVLTTNETGRGI